MNRFLKLFIAVSVLLNLLLAGIVIGHMCHSFIGQGKHATLQDVAMALPADKREHVQDTVSHADLDISVLRQQLGEARKKAVSILKAEPFDKNAYLAQMQAIRQIRGQITERTTAVVTGLAAQSSPQERAAMAGILFPQP
jgi:uncharacterized membrane protein